MFQLITQRLINFLLLLLLFTAMATASGKVAGYQWSRDKTANANISNNTTDSLHIARPTLEQMVELGLTDDFHLKMEGKGMWSVRKGGKYKGVIMNTTPWSAKQKGFAGPTPLLLFIDAHDIIRSVVSLDNEETPAFYQRASTLLNKYVGRNTKEATLMHVDAITGATYTSQSLIYNVRAAMHAYKHTEIEKSSFPISNIWTLLLVVTSLLFGIYVALRRKGQKLWRNVLLSVNVLVLGFWVGQFLSISLLRGWVVNGIDFSNALPGLIMLLLALLMPLITKGNYYCTWVCPYGSLQELTRYIPIPHIHVSNKIYKWMRHIRMLCFCVLMIFLALGMSNEVLPLEPFGAFLVQSAPLVTIILASTFLVLGLFIPRLWCRSFCPMGMTLHLLDKKYIFQKKR